MVGVSNGQCQNVIDQVKAYIKSHANHKDIPLLEAFAQRYFSSSAIEDLREHSIKNLYGMLLSHWKFIEERPAGIAKIRIFNPDEKKDGWQSSHTIIQIS